jgi:hypothetical protein
MLGHYSQRQTTLYIYNSIIVDYKTNLIMQYAAKVGSSNKGSYTSLGKICIFGIKYLKIFRNKLLKNIIKSN